MAVMRRSRRPQFDSVAAAARHYRAGVPYWRLAQELGVNPENIRSLEKKTRPLSSLARRVMAALRVDLDHLDRDLEVTLDELIAAWPVEDRVVFRDAAILAARRFSPGGEVRLRLEENAAPAAAKVAVARSRGSNSVGRVQPLPPGLKATPRWRGPSPRLTVVAGLEPVAAVS
jgi:hypothetical protein